MKIPTGIQLSYTSANIEAGNNTKTINFPFPGNFIEYLGSNSGRALFVQTTGGFSFKLLPSRWYQLDNPTDSWSVSGFDASGGDFLEFNFGFAKTGAPTTLGLQANQLGPISQTVVKGTGSNAVPMEILIPQGSKMATIYIAGFSGDNCTEIMGSVFGANTFAASSVLKVYDFDDNLLTFPNNMAVGAVKVNVSGLAKLYILMNSTHAGIASIQFDTNGVVSSQG